MPPPSCPRGVKRLLGWRALVPVSTPHDANISRVFSQQQDHFDRSNKATFSQNYFVNETFFDGSGPVFLCVGGEGPFLEPSVVVDGGLHCALMLHRWLFWLLLASACVFVFWGYCFVVFFFAFFSAGSGQSR